MCYLPYMRNSMPIFSKIKNLLSNSNHWFAKRVLAFSSARLLRFCFCFVFLGASSFSNSGLQAQQVAANVSQDQPSASSQAEGNALDSSKFYPIPKEPEKDQEATAVFLKSVTEHIIQNRGIQNFYQIPQSENIWLENILDTDRQWHQELERLEKDYRAAFSTFVNDKSGNNSNSILVKQYSKAISKLQSEIDIIRRQIVQINVDQQIYISNLRNIPLISLVAVKMPFTAEIAGAGSNGEELQNKSIFRQIEEPVLAHITNMHSKKLNIPFQNGNVRITFLYPENITRFDDEANEYVYLFQRVEGFPFAQGVTSVENRGEKNLTIEIFENDQEIETFLNSENVGDQRLLNWLKKELAYQKVNNDYSLKTINTRISYFTMFRNGLKEDIEKIMKSIAELEKKRDALDQDQKNGSILEKLAKTRQAYENHYLKRKIQTYEKYTLEHDVMFSSMKKPESKKSSSAEANNLILDSRIAANIPISGRPVKDIFADILLSASQNQSVNLSAYRERVYRENVEQTHLVQGELEWNVDREEYKILKLTRGSVGSRTQFVIHLAKQTYLSSNPSFPSPKTGVCESEIYFSQGKFSLNKSARAELAKASRCLRKYPTQRIVVTGHTDPLKPQYGEGSKLNNVQLGLRRAEAIMNSLTKDGFDSGRFTITSVGAKDPMSTGKSEKSLRKNRRAHIFSSPEI